MEDISALTIEPGANVPTADTFADQTQTVTLYLLSSNGERLVPVPAEVTMRAGESLAQAALTALLAGAKLERTDASWPMSGEGAHAVRIGGHCDGEPAGEIPRARTADALRRASGRGRYAG